MGFIRRKHRPLPCICSLNMQSMSEHLSMVWQTSHERRGTSFKNMKSHSWDRNCFRLPHPVHQTQECQTQTRTTQRRSTCWDWSKLTVIRMFSSLFQEQERKQVKTRFILNQITRPPRLKLLFWPCGYSVIIFWVDSAKRFLKDKNSFLYLQLSVVAALLLIADMLCNYTVPESHRKSPICAKKNPFTAAAHLKIKLKNWAQNRREWNVL